jgi:hypothetical protein
MEPTIRQREDLAARVEAIRRSRYRGSRKAAYTAAEVNSATWTKIESADPTLSPNSLVAILLTLWPESGGDWRKLDPPLSDTSSLDGDEWLDFVKGLNLPAEDEAHIIATIEEAKRRTTETDAGRDVG